MQLSRRCYHRIARMSGEATAAAAATAPNNRLIAHETRVVGRHDTESRPYFAMPYRPRQQRANPFSLMNHETRQRHRNTLKGEMHHPRAPSFVTSYAPRFLNPPSLFRPTLQPIHLSSSFIILLLAVAVPSRRARPPSSASTLNPQPRRLLLHTTPAPARGNASFL